MISYYVQYLLMIKCGEAVTNISAPRSRYVFLKDLDSRYDR